MSYNIMLTEHIIEFIVEYKIIPLRVPTEFLPCTHYCDR